MSNASPDLSRVSVALNPHLADLLLQQLSEFDDLSIDDVNRRKQWVWRQMVVTARDIERIEGELVTIHERYDQAHDEAFERSVLDIWPKRLSEKFHETVANNRCRDDLTQIAGLESQKRIATRWWNTLNTIHMGLMGDAKTIREMTRAA